MDHRPSTTLLIGSQCEKPGLWCLQITNMHTSLRIYAFVNRLLVGINISKLATDIISCF